MIRICAWCKLLMGESPPYSDISVTHGMCEQCLKKMKKEIEQMRKKK